MGRTHMEWARTYPRDYVPHLRLNAYYRLVGQFEKAVNEGRQALELSPDNAASVYCVRHTDILSLPGAQLSR